VSVSRPTPAPSGVEAAWVDGLEAASVKVLDRGLHYGDGLFETIACPHARPRLLELHLERLLAGCERLGIRGVSRPQLEAEIERAAAVPGLLKLILTRGSATARGYAPHGDETATRVLLRYPWPADDLDAGRDGVSVRIAALRLGENPALAGLKHLNRLEQVLARAEPHSESTSEALLFSSSGALISGTMTNVFLVEKGVLSTPRVDLCGVAGVMRRIVLREAARARLASGEALLAREHLERAEEVFLTNARIGIWPVRAIGQRVLAVGPVTRELQRLIAPLLQEGTLG
jgi:4-amino-4-deoxychorismate lyase